MESGLVVLTVVAMIAVGVFIFLMDKAKSAASRALSQKVLYRKKFEQGKHLLEGMTIDAAASSEQLLRELQTRVAVSDPPTGLANRLYTAGRQGNRIEYVYGNKFGDSFRARVVILEHGERSLGIFKVVRWHEQGGIIVAQDWMKTLFEQVRAVVVAVDPAATFTEVINDARLKKAAAPDAAATAEEMPPATQPEPTLSAGSQDAVTPAEIPVTPTTQVPVTPPIQAPAPIAAPTKQMNTWSYVGMALLAAAILWIGTVGVPADLMPVWLLVAGAGGAMVYFSTRAPRVGAPPHGPVQPSASEPPQSPAESASVLEVPAPAEEPSAAEFELAAEELATAAESTAAAAPSARTPSSKLVPRIVMAVAALVIVGIAGAGFLSQVRKPAVSGALAEEDGAGPSAQQTSDPADEAYEPLSGSTEIKYLTPDPGARDEAQLLASAPSDGSTGHADVVYAGGGQKMGYVFLEFVITDRDPAEWYVVTTPEGMGFYIDGLAVESSEFYTAIDSQATGTIAEGMIAFDSAAVYELHVFTDERW